MKKKVCCFIDYKDFTKSIFRGIGQVMFQNNAATGLIFLIGIIYASWLAAIGVVIGSIIGTLSAIILRYKEKDILDGLYGFNGVLVGIALLFFFEPTVLLFVIIVLTIAASTIIMNFMYQKKLSPYTFPFIITTWISIMLIKILNLVPSVISKPVVFTEINVLSGVTLGFSQVMFQASMFVGLLFLIGILVNSKLSAVYAFMGSFIGVLFGVLFFPTSITLISIGIFGFNGVLCGIAFSDKEWSNYIFAVIAISLSIVILYGFIALNLIALTAPFVFATWITMFFKNKIQRTIK